MRYEDQVVGLQVSPTQPRVIVQFPSGTTAEETQDYVLGPETVVDFPEYRAATLANLMRWVLDSVKDNFYTTLRCEVETAGDNRDDTRAVRATFRRA